MKTLAKIEKISIIDEVIKTVRDMISSSDYCVGDKLPAELKLSEQLGVGRSTIREAFRVLQAGGLIELRPGKGAFVKNFNDTTYETIRKWFVEKESELSDLMEVRMAIEPVAVKLAIQRGTEKQIQQIKEIHEAFKKAVAREDPMDLATLDESFHSAIIEASNNSLLMKIGRLMADSIIGYRTRSFAVTDNIIHALDPHENIVNAILHRDEKGATVAIQKHLEMSLEDMNRVVG